VSGRQEVSAVAEVAAAVLSLGESPHLLSFVCSPLGRR
jgi:hypothetical protein